MLVSLVPRLIPLYVWEQECGYKTGYEPGYETGYKPGYETGYKPGYETVLAVSLMSLSIVEMSSVPLCYCREFQDMNSC